MTDRLTPRALVLAAAVLAVTAGAALLFGLFGFVVALDVLAVAILLRARTSLPGAPRRALLGTRSRRKEHSPDAATYPDYWRISRAIDWGTDSRRLYDRRGRDDLREIAAATLSARADVDLHRDPARARELMGEELWALVDPSRPSAVDARTPGPGLELIERLTVRLESLEPQRPRPPRQEPTR